MNLLDLIEQAEWQDLKTTGETPDPLSLRVGDVLTVKNWSGNTVEGRFVGRGFWDGRDQKRPDYYYLDLGDTFQEFNPYYNEWFRTGHDDTYRPPRKDNIALELIRVLKETNFSNRLETYQMYKRRYPYLSFEYSPYVSEAWEISIVAVSTEEEVIENIKKWEYHSKLPAYVNEYIENVIFPLQGQERLEALWNMRWGRPLGGNYFVHYLPVRQMTYYRPLFEKLIRETLDVNHLKQFCRIWGEQSLGILEKVPGVFWIDGEQPQIIVPLENMIIEEDQDPDLEEDPELEMMDDEEEFEFDEDLEEVA